MQILEIKYLKNKVVLTCDNEKTYDFYIDIVVRERIHKEMEIENEKFYKLLDESEMELCKNYLFEYACKYSNTTKGYTSKLYQKKYSSKSIKHAIDLAKRYGYIDDANYAKNYYEIYAKKRGKKRIIQELKAKGVSSEDLEFIEDKEDDIEAIQKYAEKYMKSKDKNSQNKQKLIKHLMYKGYDFDKIMQAVNFIYND